MPSLTDWMLGGGRPEPSRGSIFVSYRRDDAASAAGRIHDRLVAHFDRVFFDLEEIAAGEDFSEAISGNLKVAKAALVIIGRSWVSVTQEGGDTPRLFDRDDWVRREVALALEHDLPVIPVLVEGALMPSREELPEELVQLCYLNAARVANERFDQDVELLLRTIAATRELHAKRIRLEMEARAAEEVAAEERRAHDIRARLRIDAEKWRTASVRREEGGARERGEGRGDRPEDFLWSGRRLRSVEHGDYPRDSVERAFVDACTRRRTRVHWAVGAVGLVAVVLAGVAYDRVKSSQGQAQEALAQRVADDLALGTEPLDLALLFALGADDLSSSYPTRARLSSLLSHAATLGSVVHYAGENLLHAVAANASATVVAAGGDGGVIHLLHWEGDGVEGRLVNGADVSAAAVDSIPLPGRPAVRLLALDSAGTTLASSSWEEVRTWALPGGTRGGTPPAFMDRYTALAFRPRQAAPQLAIGGTSGRVWLWRVSDGAERPDPGVELPLVGSDSSDVAALAFSPDGSRLAALTEHGTVRVWHLGVSAGETPAAILAEPDSLAGLSIAFDGDGRWLAVSFDSGLIRVFDTLGGERDRMFRAGLEDGAVVAFCGPGRSDLYVSAEEGDGLLRWSLQEPDTIGSARAWVGARTGNVRGLACAHDGQRIVSAGTGGRVSAWRTDGTAHPPRLDLRAHRRRPTTLRFSDGEALAISGDNGGTAIVWDYERGVRVRVFPRQPYQDVMRGAVSASGRWAAVGYDDGRVYLMDVEAGQQREVFRREGEGGVQAMRFSPDGRVLAVGFNDGFTQLVVAASHPAGLDTWAPGASLSAGAVEGGRVRGVAFNPDGTRLATVRARTGVAAVWDVTDPSHGNSLVSWQTAAVGVSAMSVVFGPPGEGGAASLFVGMTNDPTGAGVIHEWTEPESAGHIAEAPTRTYLGHRASVRGLAFDPAIGWLASASDDGTVRLWRPGETSPRIGFFGHTDPVHSVVFRAGDLVSGSADGSIRRWSLAGLYPTGDAVMDSAEVHDNVCRRAGRNLNAEEWSARFQRQRLILTCPETLGH